jgi:hypothetical protein
MRWAGHVAIMEEIRKAHKMLVESLKERDNLKDLFIDGRIILKWILGKQGLGCGFN